MNLYILEQVTVNILCGICVETIELAAVLNFAVSLHRIERGKRNILNQLKHLTFFLGSSVELDKLCIFVSGASSQEKLLHG